MARYVKAVCKKCRRYGAKLFLKGEKCYTAKCPLEKKNYPPGLSRRVGKLSEYGLQLKEKQKLKYIFGVLEKQFRRYFQIASRKKGITGTNLLVLLESRLDNVVYRSGLAPSRPAARQLVRHSNVIVNGKKVNIPNYICNVEDVISVNKQAKEFVVLKEAIELIKQRGHKEWLDINYENLTAKVLRLPTREEIDVPVNEQLIVELYSK
jgi:small subunit ribosomal protein S4